MDCVKYSRLAPKARPVIFSFVRQLTVSLLALRKPQRGFTLIELLVVLAIITLLAGLVGPQVLNRLGGAKSQTALVQIRDLEAGVETFMLDVGRFPTSDEGLEALVRDPGNASGWNGPYMRRGIPQDPWGRDYHYRYPGEHGAFDIYSLGRDGSPGGTGEDAEVTNWD